MSEPKEPKVQEQPAVLSLTPEMLKGIIESAVQAATATSASVQNEGNRLLAEALENLRKPYVSPQEELNQENFRKSNREQAKRRAEAMKRAQETCEHIMGSHELSEYPDAMGRSSIVIHTLSTQERVGLCSNCGRLWRTNDPDYMREVVKRKSGNKPSASGQRMFLDPMAVIEAGRS